MPFPLWGQSPSLSHTSDLWSNWAFLPHRELGNARGTSELSLHPWPAQQSAVWAPWELRTGKAICSFVPGATVVS